MGGEPGIVVAGGIAKSLGEWVCYQLWRSFVITNFVLTSFV